MKYRKRKQRIAKRKEYILNMTNKAFALARGVCKTINWEQGMRCFHQDYVNCLLQYNEEVSPTDSRVIVLTAPDKLALPPGREIRVKTKELITLRELEVQMAFVLEQDNYCKEELTSLLEELKLSYNNFLQDDRKLQQ